MAWTYSGAVGYKGYGAIGDVRVLATGGNISLNQDPLTSSGVWGAGYANAAQIAWAYNYLRLEGSLDFELTKGAVWNALKAFAFTNRTQGQDITVYPDGTNGYSGPGYCSQISFSCSEGQIVTGSVGFQGDAGGANTITTGAAIPDVGIQGAYADIAGDDKLIPYWETKVTGYQDIISWNCSYNSDIQLLKCCRGDSSAPIGADYLLLGDMTGDGSFTVFKIAGDFDPNSYHGKKQLTIEIGATGYKFAIPLALISSGQTSIQTGASYITADFNFTAFGDGSGAPVRMQGGEA